MHRYLAVFAVLAALACNSPVAVGGTLDVSVAPTGLRIVNNSGAPAYFFAVERETAARINWAPCVDPEQCREVAVGAETTVPYTAVAGWAPGAHEAIVYWWHLVPESNLGDPEIVGGPRPVTRSTLTASGLWSCPSQPRRTRFGSLAQFATTTSRAGSGPSAATTERRTIRRTACLRTSRQMGSGSYWRPGSRTTTGSTRSAQSWRSSASNGSDEPPLAQGPPPRRWRIAATFLSNTGCWSGVSTPRKSSISCRNKPRMRSRVAESGGLPGVNEGICSR